MKFSKKLIVSSLASVMAVSLVGAVTGTVAWYQYNTRVTTSLIGMNVAETGVLDISATSATAGFTRDLVTRDLTNDTSLTPITFGVTQDADDAMPNPLTAYKNPNASLNRDGVNPGSYSQVYQSATAADYIQYTVYLRGRTVNDVTGGLQLTAEKVYLSEFVLQNVGSGAIIDGLRIHLACFDDSSSATADRNYLISNTARSTMPLSGVLDCDADGISDRVGGYEWDEHRDDVVTYGTVDQVQTTIAPATLVNAADANGVITDNAGKLIVTTPTTADHASKIVVTIWMEGWDTFQTQNIQTVTAVTPAADTDVSSGYYTDRLATSAATGTADGSTVYYQKAAAVAPMWSGEHTDGAQFKLGMTFAVSSDAFTD